MNAGSNPIWLELLKAQEQGKAQAREEHRLRGGGSKGYNTTNNISREDTKSKSTSSKTTHIFEKSNYYVPLALPIIDVNSSGVVEELLIKSPSSNFTLVIDIDGKEYQRTWSEYNELSQDVEGIVAVKRLGKYILHLSDIYFKDKISILLSGQGITFNKIYARVTYGN